MSTPIQRRVPRVALLVETTRTYTRELLAGVRRYVSTNGPWSTFIELRALDSSPPTWLRQWDGDGILTRTFTNEMAEIIDGSGLPAVELRATYLPSKRPFVGMDNAYIGQSVAQHFHQLGFRQFAAYTLDTERFFLERARKFISTVESYGCHCAELLEVQPEGISDWEGHQSRLICWLGSLPKPVGIFAGNDQLGVRLLDACQRAGIAVPEEVAVVGAENEETLCTFATPRLSSVHFDGQAVGYAAAELLDQMMRGIQPREREILFSPKGIMVRESSEGTVIHDALVAKAVKLIREGALSGLNVDDLCGILNVSRSTLDRRMRKAIKRSPKEEITRIRFREIARLLRETDLTIDLIAAQTGFAHSHYLHAAFKQVFGVTPGAYRHSNPQSAPQ